MINFGRFLKSFDSLTQNLLCNKGSHNFPPTLNLSLHYLVLYKRLQESLADAKVSPRQTTVRVWRSMANKSTANQRCAISYWWLIVTVAVLLTVCKICSRVELENRHFCPLYLFHAPPEEDPLEFLYELIPQKLEGWGYLYGENCIILILTVFDWSTSVKDVQRNGR